MKASGFEHEAPNATKVASGRRERGRAINQTDDKSHRRIGHELGVSQRRPWDRRLGWPAWARAVEVSKEFCLHARREPYPSRYVNVTEARLRFGDRVDRLGAYLWKSDHVADRAVEALSSLPPGAGWRMFEQGLRGERLADAPLALRELLEAAAEVPPWVDWSAADEGGGLLLRAGPLGGAVLGVRSLVLGYASPGGNKPLVFSGRLQEQTARRLSETSRFVQAVCRPGGMRPFADGWQITVKVRLIHAQVRRMVLRSGRWNADAWGHPANQHDLAATIMLFSLTIIEGLRHLGLRVSVEEGEQYMHLWRYVGKVIGVEADLLSASEQDSRRLGELIAATQGDPDEDSRALTRAFFQSPLETCRTEEERRAARWRVSFGHALCRELNGDALADKLGVVREPLGRALPLLKRWIRTAEQVSARVPRARERAMEAGTRYWNVIVSRGMPDGGYAFSLPETLARSVLR